jgi:putative ABC transport system permease protein
MKTDLAWHNLVQHKKRSLVATAGVAVAVLLMFMQLGFYMAVRRGATLILDQLDFDLVIVSSRYVFIRQPEWFARSRLYQAAGHPAVCSVAPVYVQHSLYRNAENRLHQEAMLLGVDPADRPFRSAALNELALRLYDEDSVLVDEHSKREFGPRGTGLLTELHDRRIRVVGQFQMGPGLIGTGSVLLSDRNYLLYVPDSSPDRVGLGLVRLRPGTSAAGMAREVEALLGPDVRVLTREQAETNERDFLLGLKPIGLPFKVGLALGFIVGAVTLYQVLVVEAATRQREYATLLALGRDHACLRRLIFRMGLYYLALGFVPAWALALLLHRLIRQDHKQPMHLEAAQVLLVGTLAVLMSALASALACRRVRAADPAELF